jgi:hypothetical protein
MNDVREIEFGKLKIPLSEATIAELEAHEGFTSVGHKKLCQIDPDGQKENEFLERIADSIRKDISEGIKRSSKRNISPLQENLDATDPLQLIDLLLNASRSP